MKNVEVWHLIKVQSLMICIITFLLYNLFKYLFLVFVSEEEVKSIKNEEGKEIRPTIIFFYVNTVLSKTFCFASGATYLALILKDYL
jgi:hypothetical protein